MKAVVAVPTAAFIIIRAHRRKSLTPLGLVSAGATATIHALHPSPIPFLLLLTFFLLGTSATKVKHEIKATLTLSSSGSSGGEGPRTAIQVFANSAAASAMVLLHLWADGLDLDGTKGCFGSRAGAGTRLADLYLMGIMANYAAVTADTLSSELGILSKTRPVLITTLKTVPPGTNGGVSFAGLVAGVGGAAVIAAICCLLLDVCGGVVGGSTTAVLLKVFALLTVLGSVGTLLDSFLGAMLQASVIDRRSGKIVEGAGGVKVLTKPTRRPSQSVPDSPGKQSRSTDEKAKADLHESRVINSGNDILDNNQINLLMACIVSGLGVFAGTLL
ncbi:uncharacterized protein A1O9_10915 [Exophiala aquamarina CBS 119918]|uniref:TIGR00297 family protein n=1 Tax=Exophiala aquamarina CBS 119918 TaxID=1182545 RepID=A0A072P004_9EURO|nr:uncharacterized protein A1O9_10915 [Exophiala aquamarina CBS 119918]KEF53007.1 hypothetical protein A1O9_10915 [Exophiala aquamarina CBS 119918]